MCAVSELAGAGQGTMQGDKEGADREAEVLTVPLGLTQLPMGAA